MSLSVNESLQLEPVSESHAEDIFRLTDTNRNYLRQWLPWVEDTFSVEDSLDFIRHCFRQTQAKNSFTFVIRHNGRIIGLCDFHRLDFENGVCAIGYWLEEKSQGKGFMTSICKAMLDYGFNHLSLKSIEIECATENIKSQAIPLRLNFVKEKTISSAALLQGEYVDHHLYLMTKSRWEALNSESQQITQEL